MVNSTYCHLPIILRLLHLNKFTYLLNELQNVANASANKNKWTCQVLHRTAIYGIPSTVVMRKKTIFGNNKLLPIKNFKISASTNMARFRKYIFIPR